MIPRLLRSTALVALASAAVLMAGCAPGSGDAASPAPSASVAPTTPAPSTTAVATETPSTPTCETIIPAATAEDFSEVGWTAQSEPFRAGSVEVPGGVTCRWGDYSVATDHVQLYGWAPIDDDLSDEAIADLVASGWRREEAAEGIYVTESLETAIAPVDGYGFTYLFGDGWVKFADTKQSLVLVEWPPR